MISSVAIKQKRPGVDDFKQNLNILHTYTHALPQLSKLSLIVYRPQRACKKKEVKWIEFEQYSSLSMLCPLDKG
jgi:hypothetical protein